MKFFKKFYWKLYWRCKNLFPPKEKLKIMSDADLRYNPLAIDEDIFIPVRGELSLVPDYSKFSMDNYLYKTHCSTYFLDADAEHRNIKFA